MFGLFRRMDWQHAVLFCFSLACAGTAFAAREAPPLIGLLSLPGLLSAFAGSGLILSFLPPAKISNGRLFGTIVFGALAGGMGAPVLVRVIAGYINAFPGPGAELLTAFAVGALIQVVVPMVVERRLDIFWALLPGKRGSGS